jgi:hemerythrin-like domain-containing protein
MEERMEEEMPEGKKIARQILENIEKIKEGAKLMCSDFVETTAIRKKLEKPLRFEFQRLDRVLYKNQENEQEWQYGKVINVRHETGEVKLLTTTGKNGSEYLLINFLVQ